MLYDLLTGDISNLTRSGSRDRHPTWSPDSLRIAFTSDEPGNDDIFIIGVDGEGRRNLTNSPGRDIEPNWSPAP
jgi:TolB protein